VVFRGLKRNEKRLKMLRKNS